MGGVQKRRAEVYAFTPSAWGVREKQALLIACVSPLRRQIEIEEIIAEMFFIEGMLGSH